MRYYALTLFDPSTKKPLALGTQGFSVSSDPNTVTFDSRVQDPSSGQYVNNPGALHLEGNFPISAYDLPKGNSTLRIYGVPLKSIGQASNLNFSGDSLGAGFLLKAGYLKGFPLATDHVNRRLGGAIMQGTVYQAYGNWQGTEQTLDLILQAVPLAPPNGISVIWQPGAPLAQSIVNSLAAFAQYGIPIADPSLTIIPGLVQNISNETITAWYPSLAEYSSWLLTQTQAIGRSLTGNPNYPGVRITFIAGNKIVASDGSQVPAPVQLQFQDLIGQPTWQGQNTINFKTVLRADLSPYTSKVLMPQDPGGGTSIISALSLTQSAAAVPGAPARNASVFKGQFLIIDMQHYIASRQPDADSFCTVFSAIPVGGST